MTFPLILLAQIKTNFTQISLILRKSLYQNCPNGFAQLKKMESREEKKGNNFKRNFLPNCWSKLKKIIAYKCSLYCKAHYQNYQNGFASPNKMATRAACAKTNSANLYPPTKGYLRETCKSQNINPIYLTLSSPSVSFRS